MNGNPQLVKTGVFYCPGPLIKGTVPGGSSSDIMTKFYGFLLIAEEYVDASNVGVW